MEANTYCHFAILPFLKNKCGRGFLNKDPLNHQYFYAHSHLVAALYNPPPTAGQRAVPPEQAGGLNASLKGTSMVVSVGWESITHSLCPPRFSLLANGFASGQKALHLQHSLSCFLLKNSIFFGIFCFINHRHGRFMHD